MTESESIAIQKANEHFRKEEQAREGEIAWKEHIAQQEAMRLKTARLRAQRLARDAAAANAAAPAEGEKPKEEPCGPSSRMTPRARQRRQNKTIR